MTHLLRIALGIIPATVLLLLGVSVVWIDADWARYVALRCGQAAGWCLGEDLFGR